MNQLTFKTALPFVGGIIERKNQDETELLIQTRWKANVDPVYSGTLEFPAGVLDKPFESIYGALKREIYEETGLHLKRIVSEDKTSEFSPNNDKSFGFRPFCCVQQLKNDKPWVGFIFLCEVELGKIIPQVDEVKEIRWIKKSEFEKIFRESPEKIFTLELGAWHYYFSS